MRFVSEFDQTVKVKPVNLTVEIHRAKNTLRDDRRMTKVEKFSHASEIIISAMGFQLV